MSFDVVAFMADMIPEKALIEMLEENIAKYKLSNDLTDLAPPCMLVLTKIKTERTGLKGTMEEIEQHDKAKDLLKAMQKN